MAEILKNKCNVEIPISAQHNNTLIRHAWLLY